MKMTWEEAWGLAAIGFDLFKTHLYWSVRTNGVTFTDPQSVDETVDRIMEAKKSMARMAMDYARSGGLEVDARSIEEAIDFNGERFELLAFMRRFLD